jgi:hypothetical protein
VVVGPRRRNKPEINRTIVHKQQVQDQNLSLSLQGMSLRKE